MWLQQPIKSVHPFQIPIFQWLYAFKMLNDVRSRNICVFAKSRHLRASCCHRQKKTNLMKWTLNVAFRSFLDSSFNFIHPFLIICRHLHTLPNIFKLEYYRARCGYSEPFCYCGYVQKWKNWCGGVIHHIFSCFEPITAFAWSQQFTIAICIHGADWSNGI